MGSSASVLDKTAKKEDISAEDLERKQQIVSNKDRLSVDDIKDLCQIEEHQDPSKHLFYIQIFNTLKEWDHKVSFFSSCFIQYLGPAHVITVLL